MVTPDYLGPAREGTYKGFAAPSPRDPAPRAARLRKILLTGVGAALALGLAFGLLAKPKLAGREERPMAAAEQVASQQGQLAIVVHRAAPPAPPKPAGPRLEVLPPELAAAAPRAVPAPSFRQAAADTVSDLATPAVSRPAPPAETPIDCSRPADRHEARICEDIGFGVEEDYGPAYRAD